MQIIGAGYYPPLVVHHADEEKLPDVLRVPGSQAVGATPSGTRSLTGTSSFAPRRVSPVPRTDRASVNRAMHLAQDFTDSSMALLTHVPHPSTYPKLNASQHGLDALLDHWDPEGAHAALFDWIAFDHALPNDQLGVSVPRCARIGPAAFSRTLLPIAGLHPDGASSMQLSAAMTTLQVVVTAAHESTHVSQFDTYRYIDQDTHRASFNELKLEEQALLFNACMAQMSTFETLAYQSEVVNLLSFRSKQAAYLAAHPDEAVQFDALLETAQNHREIHFSRLSPGRRTLLAEGRIDALLADIHAAVADHFISDPVAPRY